MSDDIRWEWLDRYFSGECDPEEEREVRQWIDAAPDRQGQIDALRNVWMRAGRQPARQWDAQSAWRRLVPTLDIPPRLAVLPATAARRRIRWPGTFVRVAAVLAMVAGGTAVWRLADRTGDSASHQVANLREYVTPRGQRAALALTDGTRIMLAPGSRLRAPRDLATTSRREVYLEGEALFEVTHDASRPFVVHAAHGTAEDLGTRFVVRAYPTDTATRVIVAEGIVVIRGRDSTGAGAVPEQILRAGDLGTVSRAGHIARASHVPLDEYLGWTDGQLVFRDASVREVVAVLARWYDVEIRVAATVPAMGRVTLTTEPSQSFADVLTALTVPLGLEARRSGRAVIISR